MEKFTVLAATFVLSTATAGIALADGNHGYGHHGQATNAPTAAPGWAMNGGGYDMMQMMMGMRSGMMGGANVGPMGNYGMGPMGNYGMGQIGMMDQDMTRMMMGFGGMLGMPGPIGPMMSTFDADGDGKITLEEAHEQLQTMHTSFDANGDGTLTIDEFEMLHSSLIREAMVDRFQHLDADGDGKVTAGEMTLPADKLERMMITRGRGAAMPGAMMDRAEEGPDDN